MQSKSTQELRQLDRQYVWHPFTHMRQWLDDDQTLVIAAAEGMHLIDSDGKRYLDGVSSLWCNVHGHRVPEIDDAIRAQLGKVAHTTMLGLANEPATLLAERLISIVPKGLAKIFYSDSGATATEVAFKLAAQYWFNVGKPGKNEFVGFAEAYHGDTLGAMSVGRTPAFHRPYFPLLFKVHFAPTPFVYRYNVATAVADADAMTTVGEVAGIPARIPASAPFSGPACGASASPAHHPRSTATIAPQAGPPNGAISINARDAETERVRHDALRRLEALLQQHAARIAGVCIEPIVQGAAGMIVHPPGFLAGVRALCTKYDVLLIADEVAVGFGRTGKMFACEHEDVSPDLMCVAKGITGGYLPLAATFATQQIFDAFLGQPWEGRTFFHGHTYTGNPLASAAALASLDLFETNGLIAAVAEKSILMAKMLDPLRGLPHVGDIRIKGFMVGIELVADKTSRLPFDPKRRIGAEICRRCRAHGLIIRPLGDVIVLMPPLAMGIKDLQTMVEIVAGEIRSLSPSP